MTRKQQTSAAQLKIPLFGLSETWAAYRAANPRQQRSLLADFYGCRKPVSTSVKREDGETENDSVSRKVS